MMTEGGGGCPMMMTVYKGDRGEGGSHEKVTEGDRGGGGGLRTP